MNDSKQEEKRMFMKKISSRIQSNYMTIFWLIILASATVFIVWNWETTSKQIGRLVSVLSPFIVAIFFAYLIMPLMSLINGGLNKLFFHGKGKKIRFIISIVFSYVIVIGVIVITLVFIFPQIGASLRETDLREIFASSLDYIKKLQSKIPLLNTDIVNEKIKQLEPNLMNYGTGLAKFIFPVVYGFSKSIVTITINFVLSIVISCYLIIDKKNITHHFKRLVFAVTPKQKSEDIWKTIKACNHIFNGFLIGKTLDSFIMGVLCLVILSIVKLPYALLISVIVGITNMIPYFGPFIGAVPGVIIYTLISPKYGLIFAIIIFALQQFDGLYLGPKILGDLTGLKPLWVIFAITVGGAYFGVLGMFLGVPVVAVISYLMNIFIQKRLDEKNIKEL